MAAADGAERAECVEGRRAERWRFVPHPLLFLRAFRARVQRRRAHYAGRYDLERLAGVRTIREFDDGFIAPHFGFRDAEDYYARASAAPHLPAIRLPTLVVHAEDDPFVPLPPPARAALRRNPAVRLALTEAGGHVGFVSAGVPGEDRLWAENRAIEFLRAFDDQRRAGRPAAPRPAARATLGG